MSDERVTCLPYRRLEPQWSVGDVITLGRDRRYRILDVQPPPTEAAMEGITAVWTVQKV